MNLTTLSNLMSMAYKTEDPQAALTSVLFKRDGSDLHASFSDSLTLPMLKEFVERVVPAPAPDSPLAVDLALLAEERHMDHLALVVQLMHFMTQACHIFGRVMHVSRPITCYSDYNTPCCYVWVNARRARDDDMYVLELVKHNMPEAEKMRPIRVLLCQGGAEDMPMCVDLETMSCTYSMRVGTVLLRVTDDTVECSTVNGFSEARAVSYVLVLSKDLRFCRSVLLEAPRGTQRLCNTFVHKGPT